MSDIVFLDQPFTDLEGVYANGIHAGIKKDPNKKDLAFIYVPDAVASAGVYTLNQMPSSTVPFTRKHVKKGAVKVLVINSGNANSATGEQGERNVKITAQKVALLLDCLPSQIGIASTGIIGKQLPMDILEKGLETIFANPLVTEGKAAAEAIMTTDTFAKQVYAQTKIGKKQVVVAGITKGSGMIAPNMATTLTFLVTNAKLSSSHLQGFLSQAINDSYNMLSVDTDNSTNDMVVILSTGQYQVNWREGEHIEAYQALMTAACQNLAKQIARDGEGATKLLEIQVTGAASTKDAKRIAKSVVDSPLVKTAIYGEDPNWGRIVMAVGKDPGVKVNPKKVTIRICDELVFENGMPVGILSQVREKMKSDTIVISVDLGLRAGKATAWGCDLTHRYVDINTEYN